jgi:RHS repeat-associated protein
VAQPGRAPGSGPGGRRFKSSLPDQLFPTTHSNRKWVFTSYERDVESGNDYALARSYANTNGRFLSPDPLEGHEGDPQSWNRYAYVENDPIDLSDPSGQGFFSFFYDLISDFVKLESWGASDNTGSGCSGYNCLPDPGILTENGGGGDPQAQGGQSQQQGSAIPVETAPVGGGGLGAGETLPTADDIPRNVKVAIAASVNQSNAKDPSVGDKKGGFHETGGYAAPAESPAESRSPAAHVPYDVIPWAPGKASDPTKDSTAEIVPTAANPSQMSEQAPRIYWHVHPRGVSGDCASRCSFFDQPPSEVDKAGAGPPPIINIVVGARSNRVYIFNDRGAVSSMNWKEFMAPTNYIRDNVLP